MTLEELCVRYDADILYDIHSLALRIERSEALKTLVGYGRHALPSIITHLVEHESLYDEDEHHGELRYAWGSALNQFELKLDSNRAGPTDLHDTTGWIAWAKTQAPPWYPHAQS